ncbi:hypothetical protein BDP55DRAFT_35282 [Colletotrichum godetiae]|uniref:Uncharacterized protein n=1 Tax=Colletotrichum godetiae TaxID=1209918 RepID=A0AAJ0EVN4_9PEZI|nr:uncharacterized protein BDP55DRAFT_69674 [Colletotrichum godetiae]XP_060432654.1 uncharacterized protein BDP55DRAFT_35282 [Colletotrichum godetiae]KAK1656738.1 hypothetical protein BDP55DRAFT_69674 [Colletotrichum godetiae]KAK1688959.1 hypothetical protein BDP55DRAFT_35282 [Colletotrichum godetiae]
MTSPEDSQEPDLTSWADPTRGDTHEYERGHQATPVMGEKDSNDSAQGLREHQARLSLSDSCENGTDYSERQRLGLLQSFEDDILTIYPILKLQDLQHIRRLLQYDADLSKTVEAQPTGAVKFTNTCNVVPMKRKRSSASGEENHTRPPREESRNGSALDNPLLSTVLALGKICQHQQEGCDSQQHTQKCFQGHEANIRSFTLDYKSQSSRLMSRPHDGGTLEHVQTYIFAALYHSQLGNLIESYQYLLDVDRFLRNFMERYMDPPDR